MTDQERGMIEDLLAMAERAKKAYYAAWFFSEPNIDVVSCHQLWDDCRSFATELQGRTE